ncbi:MAG: hypothetical protein J0I42_14800 [Bosea sp.]|uniref:hypothetical protein n=1 Tax=Bosea sp. (in: a-proteobacteria) TaxID=1871050 RepID=UPI001AC2A2AD|nr:hypothetical protein [Bosea sp. (in: a-proteobacteria)]MBN9453214.1 hypothetical protein [Bosea sp. (in: a-proteobacteria)]
MSKFKPRTSDWRNHLIAAERETVDGADAAQVEWKRLRAVRAEIASRAALRAKATLERA